MLLTFCFVSSFVFAFLSDSSSGFIPGLFAFFHETAWQTHIAEACEYYQENAPKGECVLVIEGRSREELKAEEQEQWEQMPLEAHMEHYESQGMDHKSAMKQVAKDRGVSKRDIYRMLLELGQSD